MTSTTRSGAGLCPALARVFILAVCGRGWRAVNRRRLSISPKRDNGRKPSDIRALMAVAGIPLHWDIFCSVVDNYGDVGVAWRLARQLVDEHAIAVRLFVDDGNALQRIAPSDAAGVTVAHWNGPSGEFSMADSASADTVIEAFGC